MAWHLRPGQVPPGTSATEPPEDEGSWGGGGVWLSSELGTSKQLASWGG